MTWLRRLTARLWWHAVDRGWWRLAGLLPMPITDEAPARELV